MRQLTLVFLFLSSGILAFSQSKWEAIDIENYLQVLIKYEDKFELNDSYSATSTIKAYEDYSSPIATSFFTSKLRCKEGKLINVMQNGFIIVQDEVLNLIVDTINKQIMVQHADPKLVHRKQFVDKEEIKEFAKAIYKRSNSENESYMVEFINGYPQKAVEVNFENGNLKSVIIYSSTPIDHYKENASNARFVIDFISMEIGKNANISNMLLVSNFLKETSQKLIAQDKYSLYEIIDLRK